MKTHDKKKGKSFCAINLNRFNKKSERLFYRLPKVNEKKKQEEGDVLFLS